MASCLREVVRGRDGVNGAGALVTRQGRDGAAGDALVEEPRGSGAQLAVTEERAKGVGSDASMCDDDGRALSVRTGYVVQGLEKPGGSGMR